MLTLHTQPRSLRLQLPNVQLQLALLSAQSADLILLVHHDLLLGTDLFTQTPDLALEVLILSLGHLQSAADGPQFILCGSTMLSLGYGEVESA